MEDKINNLSPEQKTQALHMALACLDKIKMRYARTDDCREYSKGQLHQKLNDCSESAEQTMLDIFELMGESWKSKK